MEPASDIEAVPSLLRFSQMKPSKQGVNAEDKSFILHLIERKGQKLTQTHNTPSEQEHVWSATDFKPPPGQPISWDHSQTLNMHTNKQII